MVLNFSGVEFYGRICYGGQWAAEQMQHVRETRVDHTHKKKVSITTFNSILDKMKNKKSIMHTFL